MIQTHLAVDTFYILIMYLLLFMYFPKYTLAEVPPEALKGLARQCFYKGLQNETH